MSRTFGLYLKVVTLAHVALVVGVCAFSLVRAWLKRTPELSIPVEVVVAVPAEPLLPVTAEEPLVPAPPEPAPTPVPAPVPPPRPTRPPIEVNRTRVTRSGTPPAEPALSPEEIRRLLAEGAEASDHTNVPGEDARCFEQVRRTLHGAWVQPSSDSAGGLSADVAIRLSAGGRIEGRELVRSSGAEVLDASVLRAAASVAGIEGLTPGFIRRHSVITVSFRVE